MGRGTSGGLIEMDEICSIDGLERGGGEAVRKSPEGWFGGSHAVWIAGDGVLHWEPAICWYGVDTVGDTLMGSSSSSGELSSGTVSGEESEF